MLIWLESSPKFQIDSDEVTAYIDKIITSCKPVDNPELQNLVNRKIQTFSHMSQEYKK